MPKGSDTPEPTDVLFTPRSDGSAVAAIPGVDDARQVLVSDEPPRRLGRADRRDPDGR